MQIKYMKLTNKQIYDISKKLLESFNDNRKYFPAKVNFTIQRNKKNLLDIVETIEQVRLAIAAQYGSRDLENPDVFNIAPENMDIAQRELDDLTNTTQEVNITMLSLKDIENIEFTSNQMDAILFMIDEQAE